MKNFPLVKRLRYFLALFFLVTAIVVILPNNSIAQTANASIDSQLQYWRTYAFDDVNFKVSFPTEPGRISTPTAFDNVEGTAYRVATTGAMFQVIQINLPAAVNGEELKTHFNDMVDFGIKQADTALGGLLQTSDKNITKGSIQGREFVLEKGTVSSKLRFFLQGKKIYIVEMVRFSMPNLPDQLEKIYQAEADKFFSSFQIVDNRKPVTKGKGKTR